MSADMKISEGRSFLPTETITVEMETLQPQPSIVPPAPIQNQITPIRDVWQRREGFGVTLVGEIGRDKPISLAAVKDLVLREPEDAPKIILIRSSGGNVSEAFRIWEWLRALPTPLATVADKQCLSAALIIFLAGDLRIVNSGTTLLLRQTHMVADGLPSHLNAQTLQRYTDDLKSDDNRILDLLEPIREVLESNESDVIPCWAFDSQRNAPCGQPNIAARRTAAACVIPAI